MLFQKCDEKNPALKIKIEKRQKKKKKDKDVTDIQTDRQTDSQLKTKRRFRMMNRWNDSKAPREYKIKLQNKKVSKN